MDDDDFYQSSYLEHGVRVMREIKVNLVACRDMIVFFPLVEGKMTLIRGSVGHEAKQHLENAQIRSDPRRRGRCEHDQRGILQ